MGDPKVKKRLEKPIYKWVDDNKVDLQEIRFD